MLANIILYLDGTAKVWFSNHEEDITSWDICKQKLIDLFGKPIGRRRAAQKELASRLQSGTESYVTYIQHVLALCRKVDDKMPESEKVAHILKGITDDAFNLLVFRNSSTIDDVIKECRRFEDAKSRRITPHFSRLPNTAATSTCHLPCLTNTPNMSRGLNNHPRYRNPAEWRTSDDRPICFNCGRVGHISRHCANVCIMCSVRVVTAAQMGRGNRIAADEKQDYKVVLPELPTDGRHFAYGSDERAIYAGTVVYLAAAGANATGMKTANVSRPTPAWLGLWLVIESRNI
nr:uncharacterized protein LOC119173612 [Rhipicephalus microplus]